MGAKTALVAPAPGAKRTKLMETGKVKIDGLASFLESNELSSLTENLKTEGFVSVEDVLCLTPRKFEAIGVKGLGMRLRLQVRLL